MTKVIFLNDYAEKIMKQNIIYIVSTFAKQKYVIMLRMLFTVFNLRPKIPSQEFLVYKMLSTKEVTSLLMQRDYY